MSPNNIEKTTGTKDADYDLISSLYHTLQDCETAVRYMDDAEKAGDRETANYFKRILDQDRERANQAKDLLSKRLIKN